jgi:hypothetical protein
MSSHLKLVREEITCILDAFEDKFDTIEFRLMKEEMLSILPVGKSSAVHETLEEKKEAGRKNQRLYYERWKARILAKKKVEREAKKLEKTIRTIQT